MELALESKLSLQKILGDTFINGALTAFGTAIITSETLKSFYPNGFSWESLLVCVFLTTVGLLVGRTYTIRKASKAICTDAANVVADNIVALAEKGLNNRNDRVHLVNVLCDISEVAKGHDVQLTTEAKETK